MNLMSISLKSLEISVLFSLILYLIYKYATRNFDYWKQRGVPFKKPLPFVGNILDVLTFRSNIGHFLGRIYGDFAEEPFFGIYVLNKPHLVVRSPEIVKAVLVRDFSHFYDRTTVSDEKCDSVSSKMLFLAKNPEWKQLRTKMSPVFTTGKIKGMLRLINAVAEEMKDYVSKNLDKSFLEAKELCAKYSTDVIASCAFGISAHCFENENADFRTIGRKMFDMGLKTAARQVSYFVAPDIVKLFRIPFFDPTVTDFMKNTFWATIGERENNNYKRNDFIDMIIKLKNNRSPNDMLKFEGDMVVAQIGQFYAAGFETVSSTMSFTLYELCLQSKIQNKVRAEIKSVLQQHKDFTYEALMDMKYLHMAVCETLRKYPVLPFLDRTCIQDYKISGSNFVIEKGTSVYIPMFGLHYDPQYFPEPDKYDPERFSDQNKHKIPGFTYIPFGEGPRNCIGERFGLLASKLGLAQLLLEYEVERTAETPVPIKFETKAFLLTSIVGLPMRFKKSVSMAA